LPPLLEDAENPYQDSALHYKDEYRSATIGRGNRQGTMIQQRKHSDIGTTAFNDKNLLSASSREIYMANDFARGTEPSHNLDDSISKTSARRMQ